MSVDPKMVRVGDWARLKGMARIYEVEAIDGAEVKLKNHWAWQSLSSVQEVRPQMRVINVPTQDEPDMDCAHCKGHGSFHPWWSTRNAPYPCPDCHRAKD